MTTKLDSLQQWVNEVTELTNPAEIRWCDGSDAEYQDLVKQMLADGTLSELNGDKYPNCYLHLSDPSDVARVEHLTFVCTSEEDDAGPNNNWMAPAEAHEKVDALFEGAMQGRTMYVIPYCMGPIDSPYSRCGVEISDSPYVVVNMKLMTRMGTAALARIEREGSFVNAAGFIQPFERAIDPPDGAMRDGQYLYELAGYAGVYRSGRVRELMGATIPAFQEDRETLAAPVQAH